MKFKYTHILSHFSDGYNLGVMATGSTTGSSGSGSTQSDSFVIKFLDPRNGLACVSGLPLKLTRRGLESYGANVVFNTALNGTGQAMAASSGSDACKPHQVEVNFDGSSSGGYESGNTGPTSGGQVPGLVTIAILFILLIRNKRVTA